MPSTQKNLLQAFKGEIYILVYQTTYDGQDETYKWSSPQTIIS